MDFQYKITVFTPTYNRAYILETLYHSLQRQTFADFEWLIVDDGSSDGTDSLVRSWQADQNPFPIRYVYQENGGKCRAINRGLELAAGELFFTVDSDDYLTDDALEKAVRWEAELPKDQKFCAATSAQRLIQRPMRHCRNPSSTELRWTAMGRCRESGRCSFIRRCTGSILTPSARASGL